MSAPLREHIEKIVPLTDEEYAFVISHFKGRKYKRHQFLIRRVTKNRTFFSGKGKIRFSQCSKADHLFADLKCQGALRTTDQTIPFPCPAHTQKPHRRLPGRFARNVEPVQPCRRGIKWLICARIKCRSRSQSDFKFSALAYCPIIYIRKRYSAFLVSRGAGDIKEPVYCRRGVLCLQVNCVRQDKQ